MKMTVEFHSHNWCDEAELYAKRSDTGCRGCFYNESGTNRCCPEIVDESENLCSYIGEEVEYKVIFVQAKDLNSEDIAFGNDAGIKSYIHKEKRHVENDEGENYQTNEVLLTDTDIEATLEVVFNSQLEAEKEKLAHEHKINLEKVKRGAIEAAQKKAKEELHNDRLRKVYDNTAKRSRTWTDWDYFYDQEYAKEFG